MIRASCRYVPWNYRKAICTQMRHIYTALNVQGDQEMLDTFDNASGAKSLNIVKTWRDVWPQVVPFLDFPPEVRRTIYTTNPIEGLNRIIRTAIKTRGHLRTKRTADKLIWLAINNASKTRGKKPRDGLLQGSQFEVHFEVHMPVMAWVRRARPATRRIKTL